MKWFPDAHEATIYFRGSYDGGPAKQSAEEAAPSTESSAQRSSGRAERRAKSKVRLYASANGVDRLMTLTYGPPFCLDARQAYDDVRRFIRRLRHHLGEPFPYVWVLELHKDGVRFHIHLGVARFIPKDDLAALWPHGWVDIRRIPTKKGDGPRAKTQKAARYLSKYVAKTFESTEGGATCGRHRYEVGQGFQPRSTGGHFTSETEARAWLAEQEHHQAPRFEWTSEDIDGWEGPPTRGFRW